jgi:hypothetical protein
VQYVVALLNERISGVYESRITLEESHFKLSGSISSLISIALSI